MEYKVIQGKDSSSNTQYAQTTNLEKRITHILSSGGSAVGGVFFIGKVPYQAVMQPEHYSAPTFRGGGRSARKTRKQAKHARKAVEFKMV